jgi:hypothetical protein
MGPRPGAAPRPSTIGVVYSILASIFRSAVRDRLLLATPASTSASEAGPQSEWSR